MITEPTESQAKQERREVGEIEKERRRDIELETEHKHPTLHGMKAKQHLFLSFLESGYRFKSGPIRTREGFYVYLVIQRGPDDAGD